jgi:hypothetical protein
MTVHFARPPWRDARRRSPAAAAPLAVLGVLAVALAFVFTGAPHARAAQAPVGLGTAGSFAVLAGSTVTNTGPSVISGDLGVSPGSAVTGFPPGTVTGGAIHEADAVAAQAQSDLTIAYNDAAARGPATAESADLGGQTLKPGVYASTANPNLTGTVTLDAQGDPNAVFIFQMASTLITASGSNVALINGAQACNVFWQVGSSATLGTNSTFRGTILALTSITANTGATIDGRLLARNGAVTLDTNTITRPVCSTTTSTPTTTSSSSATPTNSATPTVSASASGSTTPSGSASASNSASASASASASNSATPTTSASATSMGATATSTPTATVTSTSSASPSSSPTSSGGARLAQTGVGHLLPAAASAGLLVLGGTVLTTRKRTRRH